MTNRVIAEGSNFQQNATSNVNTRGGHFPHFGIIGANPFRRFRTFGNNNNNLPLGNNNYNNLPLPLLLPGFRGGLEGGFNLPLRENAGGLDPNVAVLVNVLIG